MAKPAGRYRLFLLVTVRHIQVILYFYLPEWDWWNWVSQSGMQVMFFRMTFRELLQSFLLVQKFSYKAKIPRLCSVISFFFLSLIIRMFRILKVDGSLTHDFSWSSIFLEGKVLMYSPQLPYWDIRVSQTISPSEDNWRVERIMPAPRRSPIQLLTQSNVA